VTACGVLPARVAADNDRLFASPADCFEDQGTLFPLVPGRAAKETCGELGSAHTLRTDKDFLDGNVPPPQQPLQVGFYGQGFPVLKNKVAHPIPRIIKRRASQLVPTATLSAGAPGSMMIDRTRRNFCHDVCGALEQGPCLHSGQLAKLVRFQPTTLVCLEPDELDAGKREAMVTRESLLEMNVC